MNKKLIVFDMDGTLNLGNTLIDGVLPVFDYLKKKNINFLFFTNNSSHTLEHYHQKMMKLGIECDLEKNFYSSTEVMIAYLKKHNFHKIFVIGNKCFRDKLSEHFKVVDRYSENNKVEAVVAGFSTELVYEELKSACFYLETQDIPFLAANGDFRCPIEGGLYIPDCGSMCKLISLCTNKEPIFMGKPNPEIIDFLMDKYGVTKDEILVVGDRLYTDILIGVNAKVDSLCVLTGEATKEDIDKSPYKPTYVLNSVAQMIDLLEK